MNATHDPRLDVIRVSAEGAPTRKAMAILQREVTAMLTALRRSFSFLTRRGNEFPHPKIGLVPIAELIGSLEPPFYTTELRIEPGGARGLLAFDANACSLILDGILGGNGSSVPHLSPAGLTAAQKALINRLAQNLADNFTETVGPALGLSVKTVPPSDDGPSEATPIACYFDVGSEPVRGLVILALAKDAILARSKPATPSADASSTPSVKAVLENVEVEVIAELGSDRKRLAEVTNLRVGDILRLDVPVNDVVRVRVGATASFVGSPTTVSGQVAIRFARWHAAWKP